VALYLVTGGAGFIGSRLSRRLAGEGHRVITIDNLTTGYKENILKDVEFYCGDCQDREIYRKIPQENYDAIFHIAGQSSGEISFDDPTYDLRTNTESTLHLLKFALAIGCKRLIYGSSMSVYGRKPDRPIAEDEEARPQSFYAVSKLASEHYLRLYEQFGVHSTSLRLFNVYGPGQNLANLRQGMVSIFMAQMFEKQHIHIKGSGDRYRDFVYIDDVVEALVRCLESEEAWGKAINIGTGLRTTVDELLEQMLRLYAKPVTLEFEGTTPGDVHGIYADTALAAKVLNFVPQIGLEEGLTRMLNWIENESHNSKLQIL
jgi:UDP-glucose 4-epimerase